MTADPLTTHRVVAGVDGRPVLVKRATAPEGRARLAGEAAVLRALAHPRVVQVVDEVHDEAAAELHLAWAGAHSLATAAGLPVAWAGAVVGQVAAIVADLHRAGIGHGRLTPDHVLLGADGRVVLTGLAEAGRLDRVPAADDVAALGGLLTTLVAPHDDGPVVPERRHHRVGDGGRRALLLTLADRATADDPAERPSADDLARELNAACTPPPPRRRARRSGRRTSGAAAAGPTPPHPAALPPTDAPDRPATAAPPTVRPRPADPAGLVSPGRPVRRTIAGPPAPPRRRRVVRKDSEGAGLEGGGPGERMLPPGPGGGGARGSTRAAGRRRERARPPRGTVVAVGLAVAVGATVAAAFIAPSAAEPSDPVAGPTTTAVPTTTTGAPTTTTSASPSPGSTPTTVAASDCPAIEAPATADVDGDGCVEAVTVEGERVSVGAITWVAGRPGDRTIIGDWDCDGTATAATVRPSTGEVFVFDRWVSGMDQVTVPATATVADAVGVRAVDPDGDGCPTLVVDRADRTTEEVGLP